MIRTIFALPATSTRVSFLTQDGSFAYKGLGYAYIIRPTLDGASATLRITKALLTKFINAYWPKSQQPKMKDLVLTESGFGWWRVHSMSEVGDASVHRFFRYLNSWVLARANKSAPVAKTHTPRYQLVMEANGNQRFLLDKIVPVVAAKAPVPVLLQPIVPTRPTNMVSDAKLARLAMTINTKFGHVSPTVH